MSRKTSPDTKSKIIKHASKLIMTTSYNYFSYQHIANELNIKKSSIHYYFPSKETLGTAMIKDYREKVMYLTQKLDIFEPNPEEKLQQYIDFFRKGLHKDEICPASVLAVEYTTLPNEMKQELVLLYDYYILWLTSILKQGKEMNVFQFSQDPEELAAFISSVIEGALLFGRAYKHTLNRFEIVINQIYTMLGIYY